MKVLPRSSQVTPPEIPQRTSNPGRYCHLYLKYELSQLSRSQLCWTSDVQNSFCVSAPSGWRCSRFCPPSGFTAVEAAPEWLVTGAVQVKTFVTRQSLRPLTKSVTVNNGINNSTDHLAIFFGCISKINCYHRENRSSSENNYSCLQK